LFTNSMGAALYGIHLNPSLFKKKLCTQYRDVDAGGGGGGGGGAEWGGWRGSSTNACKSGRMCCFAHGREQLLLRSSGRDDDERDDELMRSRVHLTLCWSSGNTLWVDHFEEAFLFVTGEVLVLPPRGRGLPRVAAVDDFLSNVMAPDTCEVFTRYDPATREDRRAVTLARGGAVARREHAREREREEREEREREREAWVESVSARWK
jgi:hypothetical protein